MNSHLLPLFISYRRFGEKLIKYQANSSCLIMSVIPITSLFYKALILQGEIWCWSLLGLKRVNLRLDFTLTSCTKDSLLGLVLNSQRGPLFESMWKSCCFLVCSLNPGWASGTSLCTKKFVLSLKLCDHRLDVVKWCPVCQSNCTACTISPIIANLLGLILTRT